jgi:hypothetical protein
MNHPKDKSEKKIDEAVDETFPASDPPAYMGSTAVAGGPEGRARKPDPEDSTVLRSAFRLISIKRQKMS